MGSNALDKVHFGVNLESEPQPIKAPMNDVPLPRQKEAVNDVPMVAEENTAVGFKP